MRVREMSSNEVTPQRFSSCSNVYVIERYLIELVRRYAHLVTDLQVTLAVLQTSC